MASFQEIKLKKLKINQNKKQTKRAIAHIQNLKRILISNCPVTLKPGQGHQYYFTSMKKSLYELMKFDKSCF